LSKDRNVPFQPIIFYLLTMTENTSETEWWQMMNVGSLGPELWIRALAFVWNNPGLKPCLFYLPVISSSTTWE
jgi:hypothetical protein